MYTQPVNARRDAAGRKNGGRRRQQRRRGYTRTLLSLLLPRPPMCRTEPGGLKSMLCLDVFAIIGFCHPFAYPALFFFPIFFFGFASSRFVLCFCMACAQWAKVVINGARYGLEKYWRGEGRSPSTFRGCNQTHMVFGRASLWAIFFRVFEYPNSILR